jgi:hypothetical protein
MSYQIPFILNIATLLGGLMLPGRQSSYILLPTSSPLLCSLTQEFVLSIWDLKEAQRKPEWTSSLLECRKHFKG